MDDILTLYCKARNISVLQVSDSQDNSKRSKRVARVIGASPYYRTIQHNQLVRHLDVLNILFISG